MSSSGADQAVGRGGRLSIGDPWLEAEVAVEREQGREVDDHVRQAQVTQPGERRRQERQADAVTAAGRRNADRPEAPRVGRSTLRPEVRRPPGTGRGRVQSGDPDDLPLGVTEQLDVADVTALIQEPRRLMPPFRAELPQQEVEQVVPVRRLPRQQVQAQPVQRPARRSVVEIANVAAEVPGGVWLLEPERGPERVGPWQVVREPRPEVEGTTAGLDPPDALRPEWGCEARDHPPRDAGLAPSGIDDDGLQPGLAAPVDRAGIVEAIPAEVREADAPATLVVLDHHSVGRPEARVPIEALTEDLKAQRVPVADGPPPQF